MIKYLTYLAFTNIAFTGAIFASSCPRCDAANENNLKNPNPYEYYEDYLKANGKTLSKEKTETETSVQKKMVHQAPE